MVSDQLQQASSLRMPLHVSPIQGPLISPQTGTLSLESETLSEATKIADYQFIVYSTSKWGEQGYTKRESESTRGILANVALK